MQNNNIPNKSELRIASFLTYIQSNGFYGGVTWWNNEWHVNVTLNNGEKISYEHDFSLDYALDSVIKSLRNIGIV